jgi:hypothetical protein
MDFIMTWQNKRHPRGQTVHNGHKQRFGGFNDFFLNFAWAISIVSVKNRMLIKARLGPTVT